MRSSFVVFIPIEVDEILYHLTNAHISDWEIVETKELSILRRYSSICMNQKSTLLHPSVNPKTPIERGEIDFLLNLSNVPMEALAKIWNIEPFDRMKSITRSEWILGKLYISHMGMLNISGMRKQFHDPKQLEFMNVHSMILNMLWIREESRDKTKPRKEYMEWFFYRLIQKRFRSNPGLLQEVILYLFGDHIKDGLLSDILYEDMQDTNKNIDIDEYKLVKKVFLNNIFSDLPAASRNWWKKEKACPTFKLVKYKEQRA